MKLSRFLSPLKPKHGTPCPSSNSKQEALDKAPLWGGHLMPNGTPLFPPHLREEGNITHLLDSCTKETFLEKLLESVPSPWKLGTCNVCPPPKPSSTEQKLEEQETGGFVLPSEVFVHFKKRKCQVPLHLPSNIQEGGNQSGGGGSKGANPREQMVCPAFLWTISSPYSSTCWSLFNLSHNLLLCKEGMFQICKKKIFF